MLTERINHYHNLHFSTVFSNVSSEAPHYHKEAEITLVLRGSVRYKIHHQDYHITAGEMIIVDTLDLHYIYESSEDVIMLTSYIDMDHFIDLYPYIDFMIFSCEELSISHSINHQKIQNRVSVISHHLAEMMIMTQSDSADDRLIKEKLLEVIHIMVNGLQGFFIENKNFKYGTAGVNPLNHERLIRIIRYLYKNYDKNVTLTDLSQLEHLSIYHISHLIKNTTGLSFQRLINYIRLENAEKLLNENKMTLTQISEQCGFSSPTYFNKCFREWYDMTPSEYRKLERPTRRTYHGDLDKDKAMALLMPYADTFSSEKKDVQELCASYPVILHSTAGGLKTDFQDVMPLDILIDSEEELRHLFFYKDELLQIRPRSITVSENAASSDSAFHIIYQLSEAGLPVSRIRSSTKTMRTIRSHAFNAAEAYENITASPGYCMDFFGSGTSLFTAQGFPTPYYEMYHALASISGRADIHKHYTAVYDMETIHVILCNTSSKNEIKYNLKFPPGMEPEYILTETHSENMALCSIMSEHKSRKLSDIILKKHIFEFISGSVDFIFMNRTDKSSQYISIPPGTMMLVRIIDGRN